jgi:purine nucleoside phosphorylase
VSLIANLAAGRNRRPLSHADVLAIAAGAKTRTQDLIRAFIGLYGIRRKAGVE